MFRVLVLGFAFRVWIFRVLVLRILRVQVVGCLNYPER